jgi:hypothetical protein
MASYGDQMRVAFSSAYKRQTSQGTALLNADMDATFPAALTAFRRVPVFKVIPDCSNLFIRRRQIVSHYYAFTLEYDASPHQMAGSFAATMGLSAAPTGTDPLTHAITMLPPTLRELSLHTFIIGMEDGSGKAWKYKDVAYARTRVEAHAGTDTTWRCTTDLLASAARTAVTGWTWPTCVDEDPAKLYDGSLTINGVDWKNSTKSIFCEYNNAVFVNDAPFVAGSLEVKRWLYGAENRSYVLGATILGADQSGDTLGDLLYANNDVGTSVTNTALVIGAASTNSLTINVPLADATVEDAGQGFAGEAREAALNFIAVPKKAAGNAASPMSATAVIPAAQQATAFEVAA